jgi:hypothetical protein
LRHLAARAESSSNGDGRMIDDLLRGDPVCEEIVIYLRGHTRAGDTARGIAEWWIDRDPRVTEEALDKLMLVGVVQAHGYGPARVFGYTKDRHIRRVVAHHVRSLKSEPEPGAAR